MYARLLLWQDTNHNGQFDAGEVRPLSQSGVTAISLDYKRSNQRDEYDKLRDVRDIGHRLPTFARWDGFELLSHGVMSLDKSSTSVPVFSPANQDSSPLSKVVAAITSLRLFETRHC